MARVGFIGLGIMGMPMARSLLRAGFDLTVCNRTVEKAQRLGAEGAKIARFPQEVAENCDIVFTILTADAAVREVALGEQGLIAGAHPGLTVVDCSTISPSTSRQVAAALAEKGVAMLDAPVAGSEPQAIAGQLIFMVGGDEAAFAACEPFFAAMGKRALHMGPQGAGCFTKLANNTMSAINLLSFAEALVLAVKSGIDPVAFLEVTSGGGAHSRMAELKAPKVLDRDFAPQFAAELMLKDLNLASSLAADLTLPTPMLSTARDILRMAVQMGVGKEDMSAVVKCYEAWAGVEARRS